MTLKERCEQLAGIKSPRLSVAALESFANDIRNDTLDEATYIARKLCSEHKIDSHLREAFCASIRALKEKQTMKYVQKVAALKAVRETAIDLMNNYEKCPQNPHNDPTIGHFYLNALRESLKKYDVLVELTKEDE